VSEQWDVIFLVLSPLLAKYIFYLYIIKRFSDAGISYSKVDEAVVAQNLGQHINISQSNNGL